VEQNELTVGDTVQLKSGGQLTTVSEVVGNECRCRWFDGKNVLQNAVFECALLVRKTPQESRADTA
jgi:uncharacterized protein YodC (DUF2158 family)